MRRNVLHNAASKGSATELKHSKSMKTQWPIICQEQKAAYE